MSAHFIFPKPMSWDTLEDIVCDVVSRKFGNYNLQRYGRSGQRQSGVDIAGPTANGLVGIQCKHHPAGNISRAEIDDEIRKSEDFHPQLSEFIIATSAARDTLAHSYILEVSETRKTEGKYPVGIKFWDDIYNWLIEFPDLMYKHFTKYFPITEIERVHLPGIERKNKVTVHWPTTADVLNASINQTIGGIDRANPYRLTIGLSSFPDVTFEGLVDLEISLNDSSKESVPAEESFLKTHRILNNVKAIVQEPSFSKEIAVRLQARLTPSFLLGWVFRRVSHFNLQLIFKDQVWTTSGLPLVPSRLEDGLPKVLDQDNSEIVLVCNVSRQIESSVLEFVDTWTYQPRAILTYSLASQSISSAAHALSVSVEISQRIKTIIDRWGARRIHFFGAMPAALATLISYHLNAICPISIYFMDHTRMEYTLGGTLVNNL